MATQVLSATIDEFIAEKLNNLAKETHRKKSYFVNEALKEYLNEIEDYNIALSRKNGNSTSLKDAKRILDL